MHRWGAYEMLGGHWGVLNNVFHWRGDALYRQITTAATICFLWVLQVAGALAQSTEPDFLLPDVFSRIGEPLRATLELNDVVGLAGDTPQVAIADASGFQKLQIRRYQVVDGIQVAYRDGGVSGPTLELFTVLPVYEPSLRLVLSISESFRSRLLPIELLLPTPDALGYEQRSVLVYPNDTLWRIANRTRDASVTNDQQMLAVKRLNPEAFLRDNINGLKEWSMLILPTFSQALELPARQAADTVAAQHAQWGSGGTATRNAFDARSENTPGQVRITVTEFAEDAPEPEVSRSETANEPSIQRYEPGSSDEISEEPAALATLAQISEIPDADEAPMIPGSGLADPVTNQAPAVAAAVDSLSPAETKAEATTDPFDLDKLEAQIRQEQPSGLDAVVAFLSSTSGIGFIAGLTFIGLLILLLMRRRAVEQARELDHAFRDHEEGTRPESHEPDEIPEAAPEDVYTTRLKLAEAYLEMGDTDGATEMLEEVMADGSFEQQEVARRIMERVDRGHE